MSDILDYLRREVIAERRSVEQVVADPMQRARALDMLEFFDRRLDVAFEMQQQDREAQREIRRRNRVKS